MRNFKYKIVLLLLVFYCTGSKAQHHVSELVEKAFANSSKEVGVKQEIVTNLITIDEKVNVANVNQDIKQSKYLNFNKTTANELIAKNSETLSIQIVDDFGKPLVLDLINTSSFFENLKITTSSHKPFDFKQIKSACYAGVVRGSEKASLVSISIFENELVGIISIGGIGNLTIGKVKDIESHVVYNDKLNDSAFDFVCEADNLSISNNAINSFVNTSNENVSIRNKCLWIYYETTFDIFQAKGSIINVMNYITTLHNQAATIYLNEGINMTISEIYVWDFLDPFGTASMFTNFMNIRLNYNGDLGMLLTFNPNVNGGALTFLDLNLCNRPQSQKLCYGKIKWLFDNWPIYSRPIYVITHEIGHTLGSPHTFTCAWNGNNTPIDGCYSANGVPGPFPVCPSNIIPPATVGGTIMSYCTAFNGINFNNGFGAQPGDLIRNAIKLSTCLETCQTCQVNNTINTVTTTSKFIQVSNNITANSTINENLNINFRANDVLFQSGFNIKSNFYSSFIATVDPCNNLIASRNSVSTFENNKLILSKNNAFEISGLEIYPNPINADKVLFIKSDLNLEKEVIIYNILGKQVINTTTVENAINVSDLFSGIYIVKVSENGKTSTLKVVIQ